jgi:hypothetical protein
MNILSYFQQRLGRGEGAGGCTATGRIVDHYPSSRHKKPWTSSTSPN